MGAGLLGFLAAGAVKGAGAGIVAEAQARREAAIKELENSRLMTREQLDRDARAKDSADDRALRAGESKADRQARIAEGAADRAAQADQNRLGRTETITGADGTTLLRDGDRVRPVLDEGGKPVKSLAKTGETPADIRTAEWLVTQGIVKTPAEAWDKVRTAREGATTAADVEKMVEDAVKTETAGRMGVRPEDVEESRQRNRTRIMENLGLMDGPAKASKPAADAAPTSRPKDATDAQLVEEAREAIKRGAPADAVRSRLKSAGIDPDKAGL